MLKYQSNPSFNFTYNTNEFLGRGFTSQVFRGRSTITGFPLAIKIIDINLLKEEDRKLISSEIDSMRKLRGKSPYLLNLIEVTEEGSVVFIVTEQCDYDLMRVLQQGPMVERNVIEIMQEIVKGYLSIASHDIVHRDLKPANIFLKNNHVKIGDFGFAISLEQCKTCHNVGSPLYMSPEALQYTTYSFASDIWSLGVIYFQMIFGYPPWDAQNEAQLLHKIINIPITQVLKNKPISEISYLFLTKTLHFNTSQRMTVQQLRNFNFKPRRPASSLPLNQIPKLHQKQILAVPTITLKKKISDTERSQLYKIYSNQLMFCEFLFQLFTILTPMISQNQNNISNILPKFINQLLIKTKNLHKAVKLENIDLFVLAPDYKSIQIQIANFEKKFKNLFPLLSNIPNSNTNSHKQLRQQVMNMITSIFLDSTSKGRGILPSSNRKFILDNLVVAYELIRLSSLNDVINFSKKSNIEKALEDIRVEFKQ